MPIGMAGQRVKGAVKAGGIAGGLTGYGMSEKDKSLCVGS